MRLLVIDTETSGRDTKQHSLLSFAGVVWDDGTIGGEFSTYVWPGKNPLFEEQAKAMHGNIMDICRESMDYYEAFDWLKARLIDRFTHYPITVVGHNVTFDIGFLNQLGSTSSLFSYRTVDTHSLAFALQVAGKIPAEQKLDLTSLCEYFNIHVTGRHTALGDAVATAELFTKLVYFIKWGQPGCYTCGPNIDARGKVPLDELSNN